MTTVLVLVEPEEGRLGLVSRQALTLARKLGSQVHALVLGRLTDGIAGDARDFGAEAIHETTDDELRRYAAAAWAGALERCAQTIDAGAIVAGGTPRGTEVLAHVAARGGLPMAANVVDVVSTEPLEVERQVAGGAVLEQMRLEASPAVLTVAGHAIEAEPASSPGAAQHRPFTAGIAMQDLSLRLNL